MKRFFCSILCVIAVLSLFGCSKSNNEKVISFDLPADVSEIDDFKCVCSTDGETEFVIENDDAKELYTYISQQWKKAKESDFILNQQNCIYFSFQDGEPFLISGQESQNETSETSKISDKCFYGVFWIFENDYMTFTATPMTSFQKYYQLPAGTYNEILEMGIVF